MKNYKFIKLLIIPAFILIIVCCQQNQLSAAQDNSSNQSQQNDAVGKRFQGADSSSPTAVDSALKLAQEHAALSEKYAALQQKNLELTEENKKLKERLTNCEPQLVQTKKELEQANDLIVQMRIELNNWKNDTLTFRDEMRQAYKTQLETLLKILKALGGDASNISVNIPEPNGVKTSTPGDSNEKK